MIQANMWMCVHDYTNTYFAALPADYPNSNNTPAWMSTTITYKSVFKFSSPIKEAKVLGEMTDSRSRLREVYAVPRISFLC